MSMLETFVSLKKVHGKLTHYKRDEEAEWTPWKHEFGYPKEFSTLKFADETEWKKPCAT